MVGRGMLDVSLWLVGDAMEMRWCEARMGGFEIHRGLRSTLDGGVGTLR
jgi:hypothetical protein